MQALAWQALAAGFAVGLAGGVLRGLSGFGTALVMVPLLVLLLPAPQAIAVTILSTAATNLLMIPGVRREADWPLLRRLLLFAVPGLPIGVACLALVPADLLRRGAAMTVLLAVVALSFSHRLTGRPGARSAALAGFLSGVFGGATSLTGPPVVVYGLAAGIPPARMRATFLAYFAILHALIALAVLPTGLVDGLVLTWAAAAAPGLIVGGWIGDWLFRRGGARIYRPLCLALLCATAVLALLR